MIPLAKLLDDVRRTLRRETALAVLLSALCAIPGALLAAWVIGLIRPWRGPGVGPLLLDVIAVAAAGALTYFGVRRWISTLDERAIAEDTERTAGMPQGAVHGVLELSRNVPEGTSTALARRAEAEVARRFAGADPGTLAPALRLRARHRRLVATGALFALSLITAVLAFTAPEHSRAAWAPMARPVSHLVPPPLPPLAVLPGDVEVQRGSDLPVRVSAPGREAVTLYWRMQGDVPREAVGSVIGDSVVITIPRIDATTQYWVRAPDGASTPRFTALPTDPLLLAELTIDVVYPAHVGRPSEHFQGEVPPLEIPEGTQLVVRGRATRSLADAALVLSQAGGVRFAVEDDAFSGAFTPAVSGIYEWQLTDATGGAVAVRPAPLDVTIVPDAAPQVEVTFPANDTVLDASLRQAIVADARDDFGVVRATLVSWRVGSSGERGDVVEQPLELSGDDRVLVRALLDASARDLVPGDTLKFFIRVTDSSPRRQTAESRTVSLRLPGLAELREQSLERADEMVQETERLARNAEDIRQSARDLERRTSAANARRQAEQQRGSRSGESGQRMDFEEAAAPRQLLEQQEELVARMEAMREQLEAFRQAMERAGLRDAELQQRLEEMRRLYDEMLTPEMREQMEQLRSALEQLDPEAVQKALEQMAQQQEQMKEQLDRTLELMRRAAAEQQMNNLAQQARELATQQQALAESMAEQQPTPEQAETQKDLAERTEELSRALEEMQQRLREQGEQQSAERTGEAQSSTAEAGQQMQQAAQDAARRDGEQAAEKGERAAGQLERAAESLDQARQQMAESWKNEARESMEQATRDALELAERQQQLTERMKQGKEDQQQEGSQAQRPPQVPQPGKQGQQQSGQQQSGQQQSGQQQSGQQQSGQQQSGQQQGQQQSGQQQGKQGEQQGQGQQGQQQGGQMPGQQGAAGSSGDMQSEQAALQQSLQQLGRNLQQNGEQGAVNREVGSALGRANLSMQQTLEQMQRGEMPAEQSQQTVDALNRLALALLNNAQSMNNSQGGEGSEALQQMADIAKQQGDLNGRSNALSPMNLTQAAMSQQLNRLAQEQMDIARRLGDLNRGGQEGITGDVDALAREAEELARQMQNGTMPPEMLARQERLFHRMLDAGRSLEKDEYDDERTAERPNAVERRAVDELDPSLFRDATRFRAPTPEELQALPPAYRRLILDYFERLNRQVQPQQERPPAR